MAEIVSHQLLGLHLNRFALETLLQEGSFNYIGIPRLAVAVIGLGSIAALAFFSRYIQSRHALTVIPTKRAVAFGLASLVAAQALYGFAYYFGASTIMPVQRHMPFFAAPHPYYNEKVLSFLLGERHTNPFSLSEIDTPLSIKSRHSEQNEELKLDVDQIADDAPNIILVVTDSVRAQDIQDMSSLTPNLLARQKNGYFSLDHLSVANCTHFSFYSMMTGKLPNGFGIARSEQKLVGLVPDLAAAGYVTSSAESESLDWYDVSDILMPSETERTVIATDSTIANDTAVTDATITKLKAWQHDEASSEKPNFHLAYYNASHFPYGEGFNLLGKTNYERYLASIRLFDTEMGRLFAALDELNAWDNTLVIITSDHGEEFRENGLVGHAGALTDYQTKVPFMVLGGTAGARQDAKGIRSHLDIRPYVNSVIAPETHAFRPSTTQYLARCDYDHPDEFVVINEAGEKIVFVYDDGYLHPAGGENNSKTAADAAQKLLLQLKKDAR